MAPNLSFELLLAGDWTVGKSSLRTRFCEGRWPIGNGPAVNPEFLTRTIKIDRKWVKLQIWDSSGQERWMHIMRSYFRGTQGILLVYDVTNEQSFRNIRNWHDEIAQHAPSDVCKILVGNKSDLVQECVVTEEQGRELANELGVKFMLTSAKSNEGVEGAFFSLASDVKAVLVDDLAGGGQTRGPFQQRFVFGAIAILSLSSIVAFFLLTK